MTISENSVEKIVVNVKRTDLIKRLKARLKEFEDYLKLCEKYDAFRKNEPYDRVESAAEARKLGKEISMEEYRRTAGYRSVNGEPFTERIDDQVFILCAPTVIKVTMSPVFIKLLKEMDAKRPNIFGSYTSRSCMTSGTERAIASIKSAIAVLELSSDKTVSTETAIQILKFL